MTLKSNKHVRVATLRDENLTIFKKIATKMNILNRKHKGLPMPQGEIVFFTKINEFYPSEYNFCNKFSSTRLQNKIKNIFTNREPDNPTPITKKEAIDDRHIEFEGIDGSELYIANPTSLDDFDYQPFLAQSKPENLYEISHKNDTDKNTKYINISKFNDDLKKSIRQVDMITLDDCIMYYCAFRDNSVDMYGNPFYSVLGFVIDTKYANTYKLADFNTQINKYFYEYSKETKQFDRWEFANYVKLGKDNTQCIIKWDEAIVPNYLIEEDFSL